MKNKNIKLLLLSSPLIILGFFINLLSFNFNNTDSASIEKAYADIATQTIDGSGCDGDGGGGGGGCEGACGCCI
jgi:uncharacterized membrane protein